MGAHISAVARKNNQFKFPNLIRIHSLSIISTAHQMILSSPFHSISSPSSRNSPQAPQPQTELYKGNKSQLQPHNLQIANCKPPSQTKLYSFQSQRFAQAKPLKKKVCISPLHPPHRHPLHLVPCKPCADRSTCTAEMGSRLA